MYIIVYVIVYMYHIFFIHSSVDGHLGCFSVLVIVNSAAVNTGLHVSFWIIVFSGYQRKPCSSYMPRENTHTHTYIYICIHTYIKSYKYFTSSGKPVSSLLWHQWPRTRKILFLGMLSVCEHPQDNKLFLLEHDLDVIYICLYVPSCQDISQTDWISIPNE